MTAQGRLWKGWVEAILASNNWTQRELAERFGVDYSLVTLWLRGQLPSRKLLESAKDKLALGDWITAWIAAGFIPPTLASESRALLIEIASMSPGLQAATHSVLVRRAS